MERISGDEFLFIWEPVLGPEKAWFEYSLYSFCCELEDIDFGEED